MKFIFAILTLVIFASILPVVSPAYAGECAQIEVYVMDSISGLGVPDARALVRCPDTFTRNGEVHQCTESTRNADGSAMYGVCWENSGWQNVPPNGHVAFSNDTNSGYNCLAGGNPQLEIELPPNWTWQCSTDGSKYDCSEGSNIDTMSLPVINGGSFVFKVFYSPPVVPTPIPTPTPTPIPTPTPTPTPTVTPTPTASPTPTPTTLTPTPTPTPSSCPVPSQVTGVTVECPFCQ